MIRSRSEGLELEYNQRVAIKTSESELEFQIGAEGVVWIVVLAMAKVTILINCTSSSTSPIYLYRRALETLECFSFQPSPLPFTFHQSSVAAFISSSNELLFEKRAWENGGKEPEHNFEKKREGNWDEIQLTRSIFYSHPAHN